MLYILVDTTGDALLMSSQAQMEDCGVLCHLEVNAAIHTCYRRRDSEIERRRDRRGQS